MCMIHSPLQRSYENITLYTDHQIWYLNSKITKKVQCPASLFCTNHEVKYHIFKTRWLPKNMSTFKQNTLTTCLNQSGCLINILELTYCSMNVMFFIINNFFGQKIMLALLVPVFNIKLWKEEIDFSFCGFIWVWPMCWITSVSQTKATSDALWIIMNSFKHLCCSHKLSPFCNSIFSGEYMGTDRSTCHKWH